tara:strand:- start:777 stop:1061 length:285 start_codon:yes stop_codon:yes gene_type:complete
MRIEQITDDKLSEARMIWRKKGNSVVRGVRCTAGRRKGRIVSKASQCSAPINMAKRITMKRNRAKFGARMMRRAQRTKRFNPTSKRVANLNRRR